MKKHVYRWIAVFRAANFISLHLSLLLTSELQTPQLEGDQAVADLNNVHQSVEVVRGEDETVTRGVVTPATEQQVSTQAVLQRAC